MPVKLQIAVSRASLIFQKRFPDAVNTSGRPYVASTAGTRSHIATTKQTRFDVYETLCPQQMLVHKGGQIKNCSGECRYVIPTKVQCQAIQRALQSPNLQREIIR